jgi:cell division protein FtsI/penicillin-binding protein 2
VDWKTGRVLSADGADLSRRVHPGSTVKPLTAVALIDAGAHGPRPCTGNLQIGARRMSCSHPVVAEPIRLPVAIAYSCNEFFAAHSAHVPAASLAGSLRKFGLEAQVPGTPEQQSLLGIGEWGVLATIIELANAYRRLRSLQYNLIYEGMKAAAEYGTARLATPEGVEIAGKTGTSPAPGGAGTHALFAGWAPANTPKVVVAVLVSRGRGGVDAAPVARTLFENYL